MNVEKLLCEYVDGLAQEENVYLRRTARTLVLHGEKLTFTLVLNFNPDVGLVRLCVDPRGSFGERAWFTWAVADGKLVDHHYDLYGEGISPAFMQCVATIYSEIVDLFRERWNAKEEGE